MDMLAELDAVVWVTRAVHLAAAIAAIGGIFFARVALLPAMRETLDDAGRDRFHEAVRRRWMRVVHTCVALLLLTGGFNFWWLAFRTHVKPMPYHAIFLVKFLSALGIFFVAIALTGTSPGFANLRARRAGWLTAMLVLAGLIVVLSGLLNQLRAGG